MYGIVFAGLPESSFLRLLLFYRRLARPLLLRNRLLPSREEHSKEGGREGGTLCRSPFTLARLAATPLGREPTLPPSCSYLPKGSAMNLKVNNFFERSERLIHRANKRRKSAVNTKERERRERRNGLKAAQRDDARWG